MSVNPHEGEAIGIRLVEARQAAAKEHAVAIRAGDTCPGCGGVKHRGHGLCVTCFRKVPIRVRGWLNAKTPAKFSRALDTALAHVAAWPAQPLS